MDKREWYVPLVAAGLALAFVVVCLLVWLTRGHPGLIKKKLYLGGLLLTLTSTAAGCGLTSCYDMAMPNYFLLSGTDGSGGVTLTLPDDSAIDGTIEDRQGEAFSFRVDDNGVQQQRGTILAADGAFDETSEAFRINVRADLPPGSYTLSFHDVRSADQSASSNKGQYVLTVVGK